MSGYEVFNLTDHTARLPLAWFTPECRARVARPVPHKSNPALECQQYGTPAAILDAPTDQREAYRALNYLNNVSLYDRSAPCMVTARHLACVLGWRYSRALTALQALHDKAWVMNHQDGALTVWTVNP